MPRARPRTPRRSPAGSARPARRPRSRARRSPSSDPAGRRDEVARQLRLAGIGQVERCRPARRRRAAHLVVAAPAARRHGAAAGGQPCLPRRSGRAWLQLLPYDGRLIVVGPLFLPGCLGVRDVLRAAPSRVLRIRGRLRAPRAAALARQRADAAPRRRRGPRRDRRGPLADRGRPLAPRPASTPSRAGTRWASRRTDVLRVPRCPDCGPFEQAVPSPWFAETA